MQSAAGGASGQSAHMHISGEIKGVEKKGRKGEANRRNSQGKLLHCHNVFQFMEPFGDLQTHLHVSLKIYLLLKTTR